VKPAVARSAKLALYANCGDLVIAFPIDEIVRVSLADGAAIPLLDATTHLAAFPFDGEQIPAWDLGHLLGMRKSTSACMWIVFATIVDHKLRRFALSSDRSIAVRPQQQALPLPVRLFASRPGAVTSAFETKAISDDADLAPTGFTIASSRLLVEADLQAIARAASQGTLTW
jgi:hypothetical protein